MINPCKELRKAAAESRVVHEVELEVATIPIMIATSIDIAVEMTTTDMTKKELSKLHTMIIDDDVSFCFPLL